MVVGEEYKNKKVIGSEFSENLLFFKKQTEISSSKIMCYEKKY